MPLVKVKIDGKSYYFFNRMVAEEAMKEYALRDWTLNLMQYAFFVIDTDINVILKNRYDCIETVAQMIADYGVEWYEKRC